MCVCVYIRVRVWTQCRLISAVMFECCDFLDFETLKDQIS